jgi:hypothetical protein
MSKSESVEAMGTNVQVAVRCRPANVQEKALGLPPCVQTVSVVFLCAACASDALIIPLPTDIEEGIFITVPAYVVQ